MSEDGGGGPMRIVVVDPDQMTSKLLNFVLTDAGHEVALAKNAAEGLGEVIGRETDAVLVEADLPGPGLDGYELCKELRARRYNGPLIFVTQRRETRDKLRAFDYGADDYIIEPFDALELVA